VTASRYQLLHYKALAVLVTARIIVLLVTRPEQQTAPLPLLSLCRVLFFCCCYAFFKLKLHEGTFRFRYGDNIMLLNLLRA
jgi:hypothetical protein